MAPPMGAGPHAYASLDWDTTVHLRLATGANVTPPRRPRALGVRATHQHMSAQNSTDREGHAEEAPTDQSILGTEQPPNGGEPARPPASNNTSLQQWEGKCTHQHMSAQKSTEKGMQRKPPRQQQIQGWMPVCVWGHV